jgi:hypothetical protein
MRRDPMAIACGSPVAPGAASGYRLTTIPITTPIDAWAWMR